MDYQSSSKILKNQSMVLLSEPLLHLSLTLQSVTSLSYQMMSDLRHCFLLDFLFLVDIISNFISNLLVFSRL